MDEGHLLGGLGLRLLSYLHEDEIAGGEYLHFGGGSIYDGNLEILP
jgi:hypothetical protein